MGRAGFLATSMRRPCTGSTNGRTRESGSTASRSSSSSRHGGAPAPRLIARSWIPAAGAKRPQSQQERWPRTNCGTVSSSSHSLRSCLERALPKGGPVLCATPAGMFRSNLNPGIRYAAELYRDSAWVILSIRHGRRRSVTKRIFDTVEGPFDRAEIERSVDAGPAPDWHWLKHDN